MSTWIVYARTTVNEDTDSDADDVADAMLVALLKALPHRSFTVGLERVNER